MAHEVTEPRCMVAATRHHDNGSSAAAGCIEKVLTCELRTIQDLVLLHNLQDVQTTYFFVFSYYFHSVPVHSDRLVH